MDLRRRIPNIAQLQRELGLRSYSKFNQVLAGRVRAGGPLALRIEQATHGAIKCWELRPDLWKPPVKEVKDGSTA